MPREIAQIAGMKMLDAPPIKICAAITDHSSGANAIRSAPAASAATASDGTHRELPAAWLGSALADHGRAVLVATHATASLELCDEVIVLERGLSTHRGAPDGARARLAAAAGTAGAQQKHPSAMFAERNGHESLVRMQRGDHLGSRHDLLHQLPIIWCRRLQC